MTEQVIVVTGAGAATSLYSEEDHSIGLGSLGNQNIERVTLIKHDAETQTFYIVPYSKVGEEGHEIPDCLKGLKTYKGAVALEVAWVETCFRLGIDVQDTEKSYAVANSCSSFLRDRMLKSIS